MLSTVAVTTRSTSTRQLLSTSSRRSFATVVNKNQASTADKKYKVVVVGAGPGGLSGK